MKVLLPSIANQTFTDYEVIIIDDCSADKTVSIAKEIIRKNPEHNIILIEHEKNKGKFDSTRTLNV